MNNKVNLFKCLLNKEFYNKYKDALTIEIFPDELADLCETLKECHIKFDHDITTYELYAIHKANYPTITTSKDILLKTVLKSIKDAPDLRPEVASDALTKALIELKATTIAQVALEIAHGKHENWDKIDSLLDKSTILQDIQYVTTDLSVLTKDLQSTYKWRFNLSGLNDAIGPVGPEVFVVLAGPVNSGKSLAGISFVFGPEGFAEQGAKCLYIGNEESLKRTMMRGVSSYTGMTKDEIASNIQAAQNRFNKIKDNCLLIDDVDMTFGKLNHIMSKLKPDVVVLDMLDKIHIIGEFGRSDEKLGKIYEQARELAKRHQCVVIGVSQTSAESFGKLHYSFDRLAGSRVEKGANADIVLLIGQSTNGEAEVSETEANFRVINIAKSKLEGNGKKINCQIVPHLSRLVA